MPQEVVLALISLVSAFGGGVLVKVADKAMPSSDRKLDELGAFRKELRDRVEQLEKNGLRMEDELDEWKTKYYELLAEHHQLKAENHGIREENHKLLSKLSALKIEMQHIQRQVSRINPSGSDATDGPSGPTSDMPGSGVTILDEDL